MDLSSLAGAHVVLTGAAGFLGSHLCDRLVDAGTKVTAVDNFITGRDSNIAHLVGQPGFSVVNYDVTKDLYVVGDVDIVMHFASPASPIEYLKYPIQTLKVGALGTHKTLGLAKAKEARYMLASTSEVYGDPAVNPQPETYWGNVNPIGPRGVYDEAKRFAEALTLAYHREHDLDIRISRTFNTYGPRMAIEDGRAVPAFFAAALRGQPLPVFGDGSQTRSLCYVDDQIDGLLSLLVSDYVGPVNIGNPHEVTMLELAEAVIEVVGSNSGIEFRPLPTDDPQQRRPDTALAERVLGWRALVPLRDGLERTLPWFREELS